MLTELNIIKSKGWINLTKNELKIYSAYLFFYTEILGLFLCLILYFFLHINFILSVLSVLNKKIVISESLSTFFHLGDLSLIIIKIIKWILFIA